MHQPRRTLQFDDPNIPAPVHTPISSRILKEAGELDGRSRDARRQLQFRLATSREGQEWKAAADSRDAVWHRGSAVVV